MQKVLCSAQCNKTQYGATVLLVEIVLEIAKL